jgi:hypothetical protein
MWGDAPMTLSTEAEHAFGDEVEYVTDETHTETSIVADVEDALMNAETRDGVTEATPAAVDRKSVVEGAREARQDSVRSAARLFTDSDSVANAAARDIFEHVDDVTKHMIDKSPFLVDAEDVDTEGRVLIDETEIDL